MSEFITAIGLLLVIEGLAYAVMPGGMKRMMSMMRELPEDSLRNTGIAAIALGVVIVWLAKHFLAAT